MCFFPKLLSAAFISSDSTYFELRRKGAKKQKNVPIKGSWCLDCTPGVLTAEQRRATTVKCTFTFPSAGASCRSGPVIMSISSVFSFSHHLFFPSSIFLVFSLALLVSPSSHRSSFIPVHPVILAIAVGVLSDPLVQYPGVEWGRWEMDWLRCGLRALLWDVCVCGGSDECDECVV